jgi:hypothetical protein
MKISRPTEIRLRPALARMRSHEQENITLASGAVLWSKRGA